MIFLDHLVMAQVLHPHQMEYDYSSFGGLKNTEASGFTGDVNVVLPACAAGDTGTIVCEWINIYES